MPAIEVIIFLLAVLVVLSAIAEKVKIPQFIVLVIAGLAIGFTPGLPNVILRPETVFLIILPPLLFTAAWNISWNDFKARKRPIISLATGLVLFTTVLVAAAAHYLIPHFSWAQGFVLGAIIAPTDAVAAMSVTKSLNLHRKAVTILEGESLLNDASGLVAYRYAIANIVGGGFVVWQAGVQLLWVAAGGISVGLLIGWALIKAQSKIADNPTLEVAFTLLTPYVAYLLAEYIHASGILAVVAAGLYISFRSPESFSFKTRIQAASFWETIDFLLNGCVFILIGMQLPDVVSHIETKSLPIAMGYGLLIAVVAILVRLFWVFPGSYLPVIFSRKPSRMNQALNLRFVVFIS
jgi:CPA1 family monovalent cation:H+ antiporter